MISIFRTDINQFMGEVVISAHNHFPAKAHYDFMRDNTEAVLYEFIHLVWSLCQSEVSVILLILMSQI